MFIAAAALEALPETDRDAPHLIFDWQPDGAVEKAGDVLGFDDRSVKKDLAHFKEFIEAEPGETGAWRGDVSRD